MASIAASQWTNFCNSVLAVWSGSWTFWDANTRTVCRSLKASRSFIAVDEEKTILIRHENIFQDSEDADHCWDILKEDTDEYGVCHPAIKMSRAALFPNGGGTRTVRNIGDLGSQRFAIEIFLSRKKISLWCDR